MKYYMKLKGALLFLMVFGIIGCEAQTNKKMESKKNPLLCDPAAGICEMPDSVSAEKIESKMSQKPVKVIYFTDPICSSCWGIEPQLRRLKLEYGTSVEFECRMGGLLKDWSYNSGGISKPSDVAHHWDEVSVYYDMPIDGDLWLEDPLSSSYPPSIAFKAAQMQDKDKAIKFLREMREMVFLKKKNIAKWENMEIAAKKVGLDEVKLKKDFEGEAKVLFEEDLKVSASFGVRGFPTLFFMDQANNKQIVSGSKPYDFYEAALLKLSPNATKFEYNKSWDALFSKFPSLTANEFSVLSEKPREESEILLNELTTKGKLSVLKTKNGSIWYKVR
jgi:predicted DsbA family dithiol-disulfide isomerase